MQVLGDLRGLLLDIYLGSQKLREILTLLYCITLSSSRENQRSAPEVAEAPLGAKPTAGATPDIMNVWQSKADDYSIVQCAMLYGLEPGLQRRFERHRAYETFQELKLIFQANSQIERRSLQ